jgi:superfamily II DNA or RNA helicase
MPTLPPLDLDAPRLTMRDYQRAAMAATREGWTMFSRQLLDMFTGGGKTTIFAAMAAEEWERGSRTLVLENRDALVRQTAKRIADETGLQVDIEMAGEHASPFAPVVVASVPTLCRDARLTGFSDSHFSLVVTDEAHHSLAKSFLKVCRYFHYGAQSLADIWEPPADGTYAPKARIYGVTATPDIGDRRSLGEVYQSIPYSYQLLEGVRDGWAVPPVAIMEPLQANLKGLRATRTPNGSDYNPREVAERMEPIIAELAKMIVRVAAPRKMMAFMPSIKTAEMLAAAINALDHNAVFVSGECLDRDEKTEFFVNHGPGIVLCTAAMYVEGFDCPDVDAVFAGITKSRSYYRQKIGRATRPLKSVVDGLATAQERRAAIAASAKPDFLIVDPFCKCDDIELCDAYDLYAEKPEVKSRMKAMGAPSEENAKKAERDFVKSLEKAARKAAKKASRVIDPLKWSVTIGDDKIASYVPETPSDSRPPTTPQIAFLKRQHYDVAKITSFGLAHKIIGVLMTRHKAGLASGEQLQFMKQLGLEADPQLTRAEASELIDKRKAELGR